MATITNMEELDIEILRLETQQAEEKRILKSEFKTLFESLKPANIIKSTFADLTGSDNVQHNVVNYAIGMASGLLSKKLFIGGSHNPLTRLVGNLVQNGVSRLVANNSDGIASKGLSLLKGLFTKRKKKHDDEDEEEEYQNN